MYTLTSMSTPNGISTGTRHLILLMDILWVRHVCILLLLCQLLMESQLAQDIQSYLWTFVGKTCMYTLTSMSTPNGISTGTRHPILLMDILWVRHVCILLLLCQLLMESQLAQDI